MNPYMLVILCCLFGIGFSIVQMMKEVKMRGIAAESWESWFFALHILNYLDHYIDITRQETGKVGWLFYVLIISVSGFIAMLFLR